MTYSVKEDGFACNEWNAAIERTERLAERRALEEKTHVIITFVHELQIRTTQKGHKLSTNLSPSAAATSNVYHNFSGATACE